MTASEELFGAGADGISGNAGRDTAFLVAAVARVPLQGLVAAGSCKTQGTNTNESILKNTFVFLTPISLFPTYFSDLFLRVFYGA